MSGVPIPFDYVRKEGKAGRIKARLMAIVAEGKRGRVYLSPTDDHASIAGNARPSNVPDTDLPARALGFRIQEYGMTKWRDLFTPRQLVALTTLSDVVQEAREQVRRDASRGGFNGDYADAVALYLALSVSKAADNNSTICSWMPSIKYEVVRNTFSRQAIRAGSGILNRTIGGVSA
jgi:putative DNA methylase